jgi:hypothetical protein
MHAEVIATLLHRGDLEWAGLLGMFVAFIILPIVIIGFVIFQVVRQHSNAGLALNLRKASH